VSSKVSEDTELDDEREKRLVEELLAIEESGSWDDIFVPIEKVREEEAARAGRKKPARGESVNPNLQAAHRKADAEADTSASAGDGADRFKFPYATMTKVAAGMMIAAVVFTALNLGTNAVAKKSFFEVMRDSVTRMRVIVTGNQVEDDGDISGWEAEEETRTYYNSWEEMEAAVGVELMKPTYIPEGLLLKELYVENAEVYTFCRALYGNSDDLFIIYRIYNETYVDESWNNSDEWVRIDDQDIDNVEIYKKHDEIKALIYAEKMLISVMYDNYDTLKKIVTSIN